MAQDPPESVLTTQLPGDRHALQPVPAQELGRPPVLVFLGLRPVFPGGKLSVLKLAKSRANWGEVGTHRNTSGASASTGLLPPEISSVLLCIFWNLTNPPATPLGHELPPPLDSSAGTPCSALA